MEWTISEIFHNVILIIYLLIFFVFIYAFFCFLFFLSNFTEIHALVAFFEQSSSFFFLLSLSLSLCNTYHRKINISNFVILFVTHTNMHQRRHEIYMHVYIYYISTFSIRVSFWVNLIIFILWVRLPSSRPFFRLPLSYKEITKAELSHISICICCL